MTLKTNSKAPNFIEFTAVESVENALITTIGKEGYIFLISGKLLKSSVNFCREI